MLLTLIMALLFQPAHSPCPQLAGHYVLQGADGRVHIRIEQVACEGVSIDYYVFSFPDSSHTLHRLRLDGKPHPDGGWFGMSGSRPVLARFIGDTLALSAARHDSTAEWNEARFHVLPSGDLCERFDEPPSAHLRGDTAARVKGEGQAAEDVAASRSRPGCQGPRA